MPLVVRQFGIGHWGGTIAEFNPPPQVGLTDEPHRARVVSGTHPPIPTTIRAVF